MVRRHLSERLIEDLTAHRYMQVEAMAELMPLLIAGGLTLDQRDAVPPQAA